MERNHVFIINQTRCQFSSAGLNLTGGFGEVWRIAEESGRIEFFNWSADLTTRHTFLNVFVGTIILWGSPYICSQYLVHRSVEFVNSN